MTSEITFQGKVIDNGGRFYVVAGTPFETGKDEFAQGARLTDSFVNQNTVRAGQRWHVTAEKTGANQLEVTKGIESHKVEAALQLL